MVLRIALIRKKDEAVEPPLINADLRAWVCGTSDKKRATNSLVGNALFTSNDSSWHNSQLQV